MSDARWERIKAVFNAALDRPASERSAFLDSECGDDAELRREVESLLTKRTREVVHTGGAARALTNGTTVTGLITPLTERPGTIIGPYKLLQQIGEGGFGTVFLADQSVPVRRRVALKIIKLGMDTKAVVARFEAERQALALMDHPHIARVYDGGATETGRPYFVMEYVTGDAITAFCDEHKLAVRDRLELFSQVCQAVQHAHTKGVIHRDIKPGNVLVSMTDGRPFAKVIDFGIAKATGAAGGTLTDKTLFTEHRQLIGTPEYMSPEQAAGSADIDTRTDVYALGVLLYELLTGLTPFDGARLRSAAYGEMQRIIKEEEPPAPSVRVTQRMSSPSLREGRVGGPALRAESPHEPSAQAEEASPNATRNDPLAFAQPHALPTSTPRSRVGLVEPFVDARSLKGELDWIVMKALDKDRARRYESPNQLAADVQRHLAGEAVVAAPPSVGYRVRKFVRRNRVRVMAVSVVAVGLCGTSVGLWRASIANQEKAAALESERLIRKSAQHATYIAHLQLAQKAIADQDWLNANELLDACPKDDRGWEWQFLIQKCEARKAAASVADFTPYSPSGSAAGPCGQLFPFAVSSFEDELCRFHLSRLGVAPEEIRELYPSETGVIPKATTSDGSRIITAVGSSVRFFDVATEYEVATIWSTYPIANLWLSADGTRLLLAHHEGTDCFVEVWDIRPLGDRVKDMERERADRGVSGKEIR